MSKGIVRIGVDLGGTKIHSVVFDEGLNQLQEDTRPSGLGAQEVSKNLIASINSHLETYPASSFVLRDIGIGTPGTVDSANGIMRHSLNLGIEELNLRDLIASEFGCQLRLSNDVNATALGLSKLTPEASSVAYLNFGTGLAAGFVINGEIWTGASGLAGEIGHIPVGSALDSCKCGQVGCLEIYTTWSGIGPMFPHLGSFGAMFSSVDSDAAAGAASKLFRENALRSLITVFLTLDPEIVFIGGGTIANNPAAATDVFTDFEHICSTTPLFRSKELQSRVRLVPSGVAVAAMGALG